jgi:PAS domain S-box-containing protein
MQATVEPRDAVKDPAVRLQAWRAHTLDMLLRLAVLAAPPVLLVLLFSGAQDERGWLIALPSLVIYLLILALAAARRLPQRLRLWALLLIGQALALATLALSGLAGSGRLYLMGVSLIALLLAGRRAAVVIASLGVLAFAVLATASSMGWLARWPLARASEVRPDEWLVYGASYVVTLLAVIAVQWRHTRLQESIAAEQAVLYREAVRLQAFNENIVQSMAEGIAVGDRDGHLLFVNAALAEFLGCEPQVLIGRHWTALVAPDRLAELVDHVTYDWTAPNQFETELLAHGGHRVPVVGNSRPLEEDGRFAGVVCVFTDITHIQRVQSALRQSEEAARAVLNAATEAIVLVDSEGHLLDLNQTAAERIGREREALVGLGPVGLVDQGLLPERAIRIWTEHVQAAVRSGKSVHYEITHSGRTSDVHMHPIVDERGRVTRLALFSRDITAERLAEQQAMWSERLAAVGHLAASLAHEINNPMQALRSNLELLLHAELDPDERRERLGVSLEAVERVSETTHNLLDLSVPGEERSPVPLGAPIQRTLALMAPQLEQAGIALTTNLPHHLPTVHIARNQIVQVLINIVTNAIEACPEGGNLRVTARADDGFAEIMLANDGPPLAPAQLQRMFDPYFTTKPNHNGLGLFTSHRIVDDHGGTLSVENLAGGHGVVFTIGLPVASGRGLQEDAA